MTSNELSTGSICGSTEATRSVSPLNSRVFPPKTEMPSTAHYSLQYMESPDRLIYKAGPKKGKTLDAFVNAATGAKWGAHQTRPRLKGLAGSTSSG
jgi:hypothetical protein